ncbi:MAG: glycine cleavage system aminomethyltransferase GcvT [Planctomycetota bacterium]|nr:MAG: glycine cleavage system aminomethyltransferase GcvT [Planctomycetota bacterium]
MSNQHTALYPQQAAEGARFTDFSGWQMPVQFQGILAEHAAVRQDCGLFDLGHMGRLRLSGPGAGDFLDHEICRPLASMQPGQVRYGLVCEDDGGVVDDVLVSREGADAWHVVVNAGNREAVLARWQAHLPDGVVLSDETHSQAMVALQGPRSAAVLQQVGIAVPPDLGNYRFVDSQWQHEPLRLSRTGYTGEDGFELFCPVSTVEALWHALREAGAPACGLGARDLLRLEAGMPLYGHELSRQRSPIEAGLSFAVGKQGGYRGAEALAAQREQGTHQCLVGLRIPGKRPAREGYTVLLDEQPVGVVSSGSWSPICDAAIAMAYVDRAVSSLGTALQVSLRGKAQVPAEVVALPFYRRSAADS